MAFLARKAQKTRRSSLVLAKRKMLKRLQSKKISQPRKRNSSRSDEGEEPQEMKGGRRGRGRGRGKRKKTKIQDGSKLSVKRERMNGKDMGWSGIRTERDGMETEADQSGTETVSGMEAWQDMGLPLPIIQALKELGFTAPTEIQRRAIPIAMDTTRDVIGAAETGSGKTLAFAVPILSYLIANDSRARAKGGKVVAEGRSSARQPSTSGKVRESDDVTKSEVIDLNVVLHSEEEEEIEEEEEEEKEEGDMEDKEVSDGKSEIESKSLLGDNEGATEGSGLVTALDDIPEEEFLKMIGSDVIAGSHDPDDPMPTGYDDVTTGCSEEYQFDVTEMSCDLDDVTKGSHDRGLRALILTPTRELALQVQTHIRNVAKHTGIQVCTLIGGMAGVKQERVLSQHPPIVVATPGRLWKLMSEGHPHLTSLDSVRYLVLDEADRMIEFGHYQELAWILERINGAKGVESGAESEGRNWQTFVFSATLTLPRRSAEKKRKDRRRKNLSGQESVDNLISMVGLRDNPAVVDVTTQSGTVETLSEMKIMCSAEEKDAYLYYFLLLYSGQTLVFVNSISTLHKLHSLLSLLHLRPLLLHAHMQQRQRLKNFDRFSSSSTGLLLASDVAARGLDFPDVHHVIHYHVPRNSELYIHRSGRTARAKREGLSVILIGPEEMTSYRNICKTLNRDDIPTFPMDTMYLQAIRKRVSVARRIESALHKRKKRQRDSDWLRSSAQAMELELDRDWYGTETASTATNTQEANRVQSLKVELEGLLQAPIIPRSVSMAYPTCDENHKLLDGLKGDARPAERCNQIVAMETRDALQIAKTETSRRQKRKKTK